MIKNNLKTHSMGVLVRKEVPNFLSRPLPLQYEPTRTHRWILTIQSGHAPQKFIVRTDNPPRLHQQEEIPYLTTSTWTANRFTWDPITFKVIDGINGNLSYFNEWMMSHDAETLTDRMADASNFKKNIILEKIDPLGVEIETWHLYGSLITEMRHEMVMDREMSDMEITINFDRAVLIL